MYLMLKELGFTIQCNSARVINGAMINSPEALALPATHSVLIVSINDQKYYLDPGLGTASPRAPLLISEQINQVTQGYSKFKLSIIDELYIFEQFKDNTWFRVSQAETKACGDGYLAFTLLQLERSPQNLPIRDKLALAGLITTTGSKCLIWTPSAEKFSFIIENNGEKITQILETFAQAAIKLLIEFNIIHVSANDLKDYCRKDNLLSKPKKSWEVNFPLDTNERNRLVANLTY
jgi:N-hydroxyarylamine O-acetyltransferase